MSFPVIQSVLDSAALESAVGARYSLTPPVRCRLVSRGMNDIYRLLAGPQAFALKVARALRDDDAFAYEPAYVAHLDRAGFAVPTPVATRDGQPFFAIDAPEGRRQIMMMRWLDGLPVGKTMAEEIARKLGAALAHVHQAGTGFAPPQPRQVHDLRQIRTRLGPLMDLVGDPQTQDFLQRAVDTAVARLDGLHRRGLPRGPCHGDFQYANLMLMGDGAVGVLDFSDCGEGYLAADIAPFFWRADFDGVGDVLNPAFLAGYDSVRPLDPSERAAVPLFRAARHLMLIAAFAHNLNRVGPIPGFDKNLRYYLSMVRLYCAEAGIG